MTTSDPRGDSPPLRVDTTNIAWRDVNGEIVALDLRSSTYFTTNRTGAIMWCALVEGSAVADLVALLKSRFDIDQRQAVEDVQSFVALLSKNNLLTQQG